MNDPAFAILRSLLEDVANDRTSAEKLHLEVMTRLRDVSPKSLEDAVRQAARTYPGTSGEGYLLRLLPVALHGPMKEIFTRVLTS